jgi:hypothetical protein
VSSFGPAFAPGIVQSAAGASAAERIAVRDKEKREATQVRGPRPRDPRTGEGIDSVEIDSAIRSLKSNDQEEAQEDRREHPGYSHEDPPPSLDVQG